MDEDKSQPVVTTSNIPDAPSVMPVAAPQANTAEPTLNSPIKKKKLSISVITAMVIVLLAGTSIAAYFGVVVPNRPENVLRTAFENTAEQKQSTFSGKFSFEDLSEDSGLKAVNVDFNGQVDIENNAFQSEVEVTASGFKVPFEVRGIDKSVFFKMGDLSGIKSLVQLSSPEYVPAVDFFNQKLANQWMEIDETLLKQAGSQCVLDLSSFVLTEEDMELLNKRYDEVPFATIKSTSDDTVNDRSATKFELELDDKKAEEFGQGLSELSIAKKIKDCSGDTDAFKGEESSEGDKSVFTIWVDKGSKTISKIATQSTEQTEERDKAKGSLEITIEYGGADVSKPEGARPITEVISELYGALLQGAGSNSTLLQNSIPTGELEL